jgi:serine/threonine protein kinase
MWEIARGMRNLHRDKILHQDLKSCNILIDNRGIINDALLHAETDNKFFFCEVADFECSIGVVGTGFWRAPEILLAVQNGNNRSNTFTNMADVYSYAMTCYEVLTGYVSLLKVIQGLPTPGFLVERDQRCQTILIL